MSNTKIFNNEKMNLEIIPPRKGRWVVLDTETMIKNDNYIIEICLIEMDDGSPTGKFYHGFIKSQIITKENHTNYYYKEINTDKSMYYEEERNIKKDLIDLLKFINGSIVFIFDVAIDIDIINRELKFENLPEISKLNCISFLDLFNIYLNKTEPCFNKNDLSLENCCEYFNLSIIKSHLGKAYVISFMISRLLNLLYYKIETQYTYSYFK